MLCILSSQITHKIYGTQLKSVSESSASTKMPRFPFIEVIKLDVAYTRIRWVQSEEKLLVFVVFACRLLKLKK